MKMYKLILLLVGLIVSGASSFVSASSLLSSGVGTLSSSQVFRGLSLRTYPDPTLYKSQVILLHADEIVMSDSSRVFDWNNLVADITVSGIGGLDTGSEAASVWYEIYAAQNTSAVKGLFFHRALNNVNDVFVNATGADAALRNASTVAKLAQTFLTTNAGKLAYVDVKVDKVLVPTGNMWAEVYATSGGVPTGAALATSNKVDVALFDTVTTEDLRLVFYTPVTVTTATTYAVALNGDFAVSAANYVLWKGQGSSVYANGNYYNFDGATWNSIAAQDQYLKTYITINDTALTLPSGYTKYAKIGWVYNNSGSDFLPLRYVNRCSMFASEFFTGTVTSTWPVLKDLTAGGLPPGPIYAVGHVNNLTALTGNAISTVPDGYNTTSNLFITNIHVPGVNTNGFGNNMPTETQALYFYVSGGTGEYRGDGFCW